MKHPYESEEVLECYTNIDQCYYILKRHQKKLEAALDDELTSIKDKMIELLNEIISFKKVINAEYDMDEVYISKLK